MVPSPVRTTSVSSWLPDELEGNRNTSRHQRPLKKKEWKPEKGAVVLVI